MVKIAVCDDSKYMRGEVRKRILQYSMKKDFDYTVEEYEVGEKLIESEVKYDLIFMDYEFEDNGANGLEIARKIREDDKNSTIVFVSSYPSIVFDTFEVGTFRFLIKPIDDKKFNDVLDSSKIQSGKIDIIIDEYDTPIQQGHLQDFYEHIIVFMPNFFSSGVKDNPYLSFAFLTGILRVAKESIFSGMNNLKVNSILDERYSQYFGFTREEVRNILSYYGRSDHMDEITDWYDGYLFGSTEIFNPWSVINFLDDGCYPKAFWQSTGNNAIIREIVSHASPEILEDLQQLLQGNTISAYIDTSVIYPEIQNNPSTVYSFLLIAGYLKVQKREPCHDGNFICDVSIPNREISYVYEKEILSGLSGMISQSTAIGIQQAIYQQDIPKLQTQLRQFLQQTVSFHDTAKESFYHGLVIGLCAIMNHTYFVSSNREAGDGRFDIQLLPHNKNLPGILMELKVLNGKEKNVTEKLTELSMAALLQIADQGYATTMTGQGVSTIMTFGIAFYKKQVEIAYEMKIF